MSQVCKMPRNARFWIYWNGDYVKLTMAPGQRIDIGQRGPHEEGWSAEYESYEHTGAGVFCEHLSEGRGCDGYSRHYGTSYCPLSELGARENDWDSAGQGLRMPRWGDSESEQRDEYAEMSAY